MLEAPCGFLRAGKRLSSFGSQEALKKHQTKAPQQPGWKEYLSCVTLIVGAQLSNRVMSVTDCRQHTHCKAGSKPSNYLTDQQPSQARFIHICTPTVAYTGPSPPPRSNVCMGPLTFTRVKTSTQRPMPLVRLFFSLFFAERKGCHKMRPPCFSFPKGSEMFLNEIFGTRDTIFPRPRAAANPLLKPCRKSLGRFLKFLLTQKLQTAKHMFSYYVQYFANLNTSESPVRCFRTSPSSTRLPS